MSVPAVISRSDEDLVRDVLGAAGARGASHEDFVEAGLAHDYIAALRHLVDDRGVRVRTDFTSCQARWALVSDAPHELRAA